VGDKFLIGEMTEVATRLTIGVVITNYNSWDLALNSVRAHLDYAGHAIERIIIVDDCSDRPFEGSELDPRIRVVRNESNLGFVRSVNVGFKHLDTDLVLLFDADAYPLMDYSPIIQREFSRDETLGVLGFATYGRNNQATGSADHEPGVLSLVLGQQLDRLYKKYFRRRTKAAVVYSCAMSVRRLAFEEVGGFDENFDWLEPDNDFCIRIRRQGWVVKSSSEIKAFHEGGGTPQRASDRVLRYYKNKWYLLRKHGKVRNVALVRAAILLRLRVEYLVLLLFGRLLFSDREVLLDKLSGRRRIISYCKEHYY
jgi:GT2 family glycosyltransferase